MKKIRRGPYLKLTQLTKHFGGICAVNGFDLEVKKGEIMGLIGPNGAGKTTVYNLVNGVFKPTRGSVIFRGEDITGLAANKVAKKGLVRTFQSNTLFPDFTVIENLLMGSHLHGGIGIVQDLINLPSVRKKRRQTAEKAEEILKFTGLTDFRNESAKNLSHGHQRILGIGIALAAGPELLMLDEPVTGMNATEKKGMIDLIGRIRRRGITLMVVEHDMGVVMALCDRIAVINFGEKIALGTPEEIQTDAQVIHAYLGAKGGGEQISVKEALSEL